MNNFFEIRFLRLSKNHSSRDTLSLNLNLIYPVCRNPNGQWDEVGLAEFRALLKEGEQSERALEATIYSVVEADRRPNRFLINLTSLAIFNQEGDKIGLLFF
jgi:hypothetical protein